MQIPHALPPRITDLSTEDASALAEAQPERRREYVQIQRGKFRGALNERLYGSVGLGHESWSCALRVRCGRSRSYVAFASVTSEPPPALCGMPLDARSVAQVDHDWELASRDALEMFCFAVETKRLEQAEATLTDRDVDPGSAGNRVLRGPGFAAARTLRHSVTKALDANELAPEALRTLESDLVHLAVQLRTWGSPSAQPESATRRRAAVRRIEDYIAAHPAAVPSMMELCALAGVSERTLEYAFRERIGLPPQRYLRMRRLNLVRSELRSCDPEALSVSEAAMRWGFWELGRFAGEYRALFGELPSATLARRRPGRGRREIMS